MLRSRTVSLLAAALIVAPPGAFANPQGGQVVGGAASIQGQGTPTVTVTQSSQNAIINWYTFNIGAGETTQFIQPNAGAIALNRVTGGLGPSTIYGHLKANGRIFLINPDGIMIGPGGMVNAAGFLASTNNIKDSDFMAGNYKFTIPGRLDASIVNLGTITAASGGFAALVAPGVRNAGMITANLGHVTLASGNGFTLDFYGDKLITLQVGDQIANKVIDVATGQTLDALVKNEGTLKANGGQVALTAAAARHVVDSVINTSGVIEANSVGMKNGMIVLGGATAATKGTDAPTQTVKVSGTLSAAGHKKGTKGGVIQVSGEDIQVAGAKINASGQAGGGTVLIGGDTGGGSVNAAVSGVKQAQLQPWAVATASTVSIDAATVIDASAKVAGDGGKVVVWSNQATTFAGLIKATGGAIGGNGGFAEVSSHGVLSYTGLANLGAPKGAAGTLLLDPANVLICDDCYGQTIDSEDLSAQLNKQSVIITTGKGDGQGNITVAAPVTWSSNQSLTLSAYANIAVNANLTSTGGGAVKLHADNTGTGTGTVTFGHTHVGDMSVPAQVSTSGHVTIFYNPSNPVGASNTAVNSLSYTTPTDYSAAVTGGASLTAYMLVNTVYDLQNVQNNLGGTYALGRKINAGVTATWNGGQGFKPIGQTGSGFGGTFNGMGNQIDGLTIAPTAQEVSNIGLFGINSGTIKNVELTNVSIKANPFTTAFTQYVGGLAGLNFGTIRHVAVTGGTVDGGTMAGVAAGGLVGQNWVATASQPGVIKHSTAAVDVKVGDGCFNNCPFHGANYAGGLVGLNSGIISHSAASGNVTAGSNTFAGGLVGQNVDFSGAHFVSLIKDSFATGDVTSAGTNVSLGGLVGANGFLFSNDGPPTITGVIKNSHAGGHVTGTDNVDNSNCGSGSGGCGFVSVGGLVGQNAGLIQGPMPSKHGADAALGDAAFAGVGCGTGATCASGMVSAGAGGQVGGLVGYNQGVINYAFAIGGPDAVHVGANGTAGGLVGFNTGTISKTFATGGVTGDAGVGIGQDGFNKATTLGGLVGQNFGLIDHSFAKGAVGSLTVANLEVGGLVGFNSGTIDHGFAKGNVSAGANGSAGGLVGENHHEDFSCDGCNPGIGHNDAALIIHSGSKSTVTVGAASIAGGLAAANGGTITSSHSKGNVFGDHDSILGGLVAINKQGTISNTSATGAVTGGDNSILGTFAAVNDLNSLIQLSSATGAVTSTGPNSVIGGFVGMNGGTVENSHTNSAVTGTSNSYVGGFVGINIGSVVDSQVAGPASVTVTGTGNLVGGFVGVNMGAIDPSTTVVTPTADSNNIVGGFAGANLNFASFNFGNLQLPAPSFPTGTITKDSTTTDTIHLFIGTDGVKPGFAPLPSVINSCTDAVCQIFQTGILTPCTDASCQPAAPTDSTSPINPQPQFQLFMSPTPPNNTPILINLTTGGTGQSGGSGDNNGSAKPNYGPPPGPGLGRTLDEQQYSGVPPPNETRFRSGEVVIQVVDTIPVEQVVKIAEGFGMVLISSQHLDQTRRVLYRFRATGKADVRALIRAFEKNKLVASAEPNYVFVMAQNSPAPTGPAAPATPAPPAGPPLVAPPPNEATPDLANSDTAALQTLPAGDAAQYVIEKFHLGAVHRLASGRNVLIAVVDSEIDAAHPDLRGVIVERFDATQSPSRPHPHGTGMAGAIASHSRLLGVAPGARIVAIKAFDDSGSSAESTSYQIIKGLDYAVAKNVRIINMSFAGPRDPMMERTLKAAHDKGIVLIAAAGNAGPKSSPLYPGADVSVIAVSATDYEDKPFAMANRGKYIAVAAPGVDVMVPAPGGSYQLTTGTSVAAAHVSGVAALLLERNPSIKPDELRALLMKTATAFSAKPKGEEDGAGLVDPVGALQALAGAKTSESLPGQSGVSANVH
jgi:filamentous hemagglutinin family protein